MWMRGKFSSMTWNRDNTLEWIAQLEHRIEDITYHVNQAVEWCKKHDIYSDEKIIACMVITVIWVANMRNEQISRREVFEILGFTDTEGIDDDIYELNTQMLDKDLDELLNDVIQSYNS